MGVALVTLPDGKRARVTFDTPDQLDATVDDLVQQHARPQTLSEKLSDNPVTRGVGEAGLQMAGGMAGAAAGGIRGIYDVATGQGTDKAVEDIESTQKALSYEPKTAEGKAVSSAVAAPFTWLAGKADVAGEDVAGAVKSGAHSLGASEETAGKLGAGAGAIANTAVQAAPSAVLGVAGKGVSTLRGAAAAREAAAARPRVEPTLEPAQAAPQPAGAAPGQPATATPPAQLSATGAPRQPYSQVGSGPAPRASRPPPNPLEAKAREYARTIGLDFDRLGAGTRKALTTIAQDATALQKLDPAALKREALLSSQRVPVPATRGQLTRDPAELRREAIVSRTDAGAPIRDVDVAANKAVQSNLEALRGRAAGLRGGLHDPVSEEGVPAATPSIRAPTKLPSQVGEAGQKAAREKQKWSKKGADALYERARRIEPEAAISAKPLKDLLEKNPDIQHLGFLKSWLSNAAKSKKGGDNLSLAALHDLRSTAGEIGKTPTTDGVYARKVVRAIDESMKEIPAGFKAWKAADKAWEKHQSEFHDQDAVRALVSNKKGSANPSIPHEKTVEKLAKGSLQNLKQAKRTWLTGGTPQLREMGRRAYRGMRGEVVNNILESARNVVATDETEREILTAAALHRAIKSYPRENLEEILGKRNVRELNEILRTAKITRTQPSARVTESGTAPNMLLMMEKILGHIPGGKYIVGGAKLAKKLGEEGKAGETVRRATTSPLEEAAQKAKGSTGARRIKRAMKYQELENTGPSLPDPTIGDALKGP